MMPNRNNRRIVAFLGFTIGFGFALQKPLGVALARRGES
jgi:hypothetical protein